MDWRRMLRVLGERGGRMGEMLLERGRSLKGDGADERYLRFEESVEAAVASAAAAEVGVGTERRARVLLGVVREA